MTLDSPAPPRRGRAPKRDAVLYAARLVFGRQGYTRTSIDAIAAEAAVSTRTIYNHFDSKEELFNSVLLHSAGRVADDFVAGLTRDLTTLGPEADARSILEAVGRAMVAHTADNPEHFALVRQIGAEADRVPAAVLAGWQEAGPLRVHFTVAKQLSLLSDRGLLRVDDPRRAALHFIVLVQAEAGQPVPGMDVPVNEPPGRGEAVAAGVHAFLYGYLPSSDRSSMPATR
jgi:AcrR family transcriptional regulator